MDAAWSVARSVFGLCLDLSLADIVPVGEDSFVRWSSSRRGDGPFPRRLEFPLLPPGSDTQKSPAYWMALLEKIVGEEKAFYDNLENRREKNEKFRIELVDRVMGQLPMDASAARRWDADRVPSFSQLKTQFQEREEKVLRSSQGGGAQHRVGVLEKDFPVLARVLQTCLLDPALSVGSIYLSADSARLFLPRFAGTAFYKRALLDALEVTYGNLSETLFSNPNVRRQVVAVLGQRPDIAISMQNHKLTVSRLFPGHRDSFGPVAAEQYAVFLVQAMVRKNTSSAAADAESLVCPGTSFLVEQHHGINPLALRLARLMDAHERWLTQPTQGAKDVGGGLTRQQLLLLNPNFMSSWNIVALLKRANLLPTNLAPKLATPDHPILQAHFMLEERAVERLKKQERRYDFRYGNHSWSNSGRIVYDGGGGYGDARWVIGAPQRDDEERVIKEYWDEGHLYDVGVREQRVNVVVEWRPSSGAGY